MNGWSWGSWRSGSTSTWSRVAVRARRRVPRRTVRSTARRCLTTQRAYLLSARDDMKSLLRSRSLRCGERDGPRAEVTNGAEPGRGRRQQYLGRAGGEDELPQGMLAPLPDVAEVCRQQLVLRVRELGVRGHQTRALEAEPFVGPDALLLGAHHRLARADLVEEVDEQLEETERDARHDAVAPAVLREDREACHLDRARRDQVSRKPEVLLGLERTGRARRDAHRPHHLARAHVLGEQEPGARIVLVRHRDVVAAVPQVDAAPDVERGLESDPVRAHAEAVAPKQVREGRGLELRPPCRGPRLDVSHGVPPAGRLCNRRAAPHVLRGRAVAILPARPM